ncbi:MAG: alanine racemase, partial [Pseudomonadota bacterium]
MSGSSPPSQSGGVSVGPAPSSKGRLTVDLDALAANYRTLRQRSAPAETGAVVKCDAYGLGLAPVANALRDAGCRTFFVAQAEEGAKLRACLAPDQPDVAIYVFSGCMKDEENLFRSNALRPVLNSLTQIERWAAFVRSRPDAPAAAIHVDTGMNRLGLSAEEFAGLRSDAGVIEALKADLVMSHLANGAEPANPMNRRQAERFAEVAAALPGVRASLANSAGVLLGEAYRFDLTRPGIAIYGGGPFGDPHPDLRCVAT